MIKKHNAKSVGLNRMSFYKIRAESFAFEYIRITLKSLNFKLITTTNFDYLFNVSLAIVAIDFY